MNPQPPAKRTRLSSNTSNQGGERIIPPDDRSEGAEIKPSLSPSEKPCPYNFCGGKTKSDLCDHNEDHIRWNSEAMCWFDTLKILNEDFWRMAHIRLWLPWGEITIEEYLALTALSLKLDCRELISLRNAQIVTPRNKIYGIPARDYIHRLHRMYKAHAYIALTRKLADVGSNREKTEATDELWQSFLDETITFVPHTQSRTPRRPKQMQISLNRRGFLKTRYVEREITQDMYTAAGLTDMMMQLVACVKPVFTRSLRAGPLPQDPKQIFVQECEELEEDVRFLFNYVASGDRSYDLELLLRILKFGLKSQSAFEPYPKWPAEAPCVDKRHRYPWIPMTQFPRDAWYGRPNEIEPDWLEEEAWVGDDGSVQSSAGGSQW